MHNHRFPGESSEYRAARDQLLLAERDLRGNVEKVAALRRKLPLGARVPTDYVFEEGAPDGVGVQRVAMSGLFAPGSDTLVVYSYMFGPAMAEPCHMCSPFLDGLNGNARHLSQRVNLAVVAKSPAPENSPGWLVARLARPASVVLGEQHFQPRFSRRGAERRSELHHPRLREAARWRPPLLQLGARVPACRDRSKPAAHRHDVALVERARPYARGSRRVVPFAHLLTTGFVGRGCVRSQTGWVKVEVWACAASGPGERRSGPGQGGRADLGTRRAACRWRTRYRSRSIHRAR